MRPARYLAQFALILSVAVTPQVVAQGDANQIVPLNAYKDLKWRSVGATRGGRVTAYSGVRQQPHTFYFGGVGGGVWKTDDAGISWAPVSDGQIATGSIGSIDVAPSNPNHVWAGTGSVSQFTRSRECSQAMDSVVPANSSVKGNSALLPNTALTGESSPNTPL